MKRPLVGWIAFCILAFPSVCLLGYLALSSVVPELASSPTSISPPSVLYTGTLQAVAGDKPSLSPGEQESRAVAGQRAAQGKQQKPKPVTFTHKFKPPPEGIRKMAARTQVTMGEIWNGTIEVLNQDSVPAWYEVNPTETITFGALGGGVTANCFGLEKAYSKYSNPGDPDWYGLYEKWQITASAPGDSDIAYLYVWMYDANLPASMWGPLANPSWPVVDHGFAIDVSLSVNGVYLKRSRTPKTLSNRQLMDWSDLDAVDLWYADDTSTVAVTGSGAGISVSANGSLGYTPGQEVEIGTSYVLSAAVTLNSAPTVSTPYAAITGINWGTTSVSTGNIDLYNPGAAAGIPSVDINPWSRTQNTSNCYHVYGYSGGYAIEHLQGSGGAISAALKWSAPKILTLTPIDGMFDKQGPSYDIEYTSTPITWTSTTEYEATKFSAPISVAEYPTNFEYEYEYKKLSGNTITVTVTDDWRTLNDEAVGSDTPGVAAEYCDKLCGLILPGLVATDCTSDPFWLSGMSFTHITERDFNDTSGVARRASWWMGGVGVTINPLDNDIWQVAPGAATPQITRTLRSRYRLRTQRLGDWKNDPEEEHNPFWHLMFKANLAIETTLDDPDWWEEPLVTVAGAGTGGVNGEYNEFGSAGGQQQYQYGSVYIRYNRDEARWELVEGGAVYYTCSTLTGVWEVLDGTAPAPTVSLYWPSEGELYSCLYEDIYSWANYRYILAQINAPTAGVVTLRVNYSVPSIADPNYTSFDPRYGETADIYGGWTCSFTDYFIDLEFGVVEGSGTYLLDMLANVQQVFPVGDLRRALVTSVRFTLPDNVSGGIQQWELQQLKLVEDPGEPGRAAPDTHCVMRFKRSWSWLDPNFNDDSEDAVHAPMNWFGFGAHNDGIDALELDYGYLTSQGQTGNERKLLYIQYRQHDPESGLSDLMHYAKEIGELVNEINWQEGFSGVATTSPTEHANNKDTDDNYVDGTLNWWDVHQSNEAIDWNDVPMGLCTGSWSMAAGVAYDMRFYCYPRGAIHGVAMDEAHTMCYRNTSNCVYIFGGKQGAIGLLGIEDTDEHGRFRYDEAREDEWTYAVRVSPLSVPTQPTICPLTAVNRSYTSVVVAWGDWPAWLSATPASFQAIGLLNSEPGGDVYYRAQNWGRGWERPGAVPMSTTVGGFGSLAHDPASWEFYALHQLGVSTYLQVSERFGGQWKTEFPNVVGFVGGQGVIVNSRVYSLGSISSFYYLARQRPSDGALLGPLNLVGTGAGVPGSITRHDATGVLWAALPLGDDTLIYVSVDDGSSWTHVETVDCQYGTVVSVAHKMLVAGYMPLVVGGANGIVKVTTLDVNTGARVGQPLTVARADWPKCALVYQPSEGFIHLFTIKDNDWTTDTWTPRYSYTPGLLASYERVPCGSSNGAFTQLFGERRLGLTFDEHWNDAYTTWINPALHPYWCTQTPYTGSEVVQPGDLVVSNYGGWWYTSVYHGEVGGVPHHVHCGYPGVPQGVLTPMVDPVIGWYRRQYTPSIVEWVSDDDAETFVQTRIIPRV